MRHSALDRINALEHNTYERIRLSRAVLAKCRPDVFRRYAWSWCQCGHTDVGSEYGETE